MLLERRLKAIAMRKKGATFQEISDALGYASAPSAYMSLKYELDTQRADAVEMLRELEAKRLAAAERAIWPRVVSGQDLEAIGLFLRISRRRAMLFGLDAKPTGGDGAAKAQAQAQVVIQLGDKPTETLQEPKHDENLRGSRAKSIDG
jgi:hypothetical protein